jgi:hypothetical protein
VGYEQFIPFVVTIIGIISTNLLNGIVIGLPQWSFLGGNHQPNTKFFLAQAV